jgi:ABC-type dipeptide/oligopeptide/nickel transport system ATPase component
MISDNLVLNSVIFKPLFGAKAAPELRATIKVVQAQNTTASVSEIKSQVIQYINNYFTIDKWDFGDNFFFSELSAYLHQNLGSIISSVVLVPLNPLKSFGDLYEIRSAANEIFVSAATVADVEVITALTQSNIRSQTSVSGLYPNSISQGTSGQRTVITNTQSSSSSSGGGGGYSPSSNGGGY